MKPTQNNGKNSGWREPEPGSTQKFITPEAEKSMREGAGRYRVVKAGNSDAPRQRKKPDDSAAAKNRPTGARKAPKKQNLSLGEALRAELHERLSIIGHSITINSEDIVKGVIIAAFMIFALMMQTTFFSHFPPFGAVPDLMLALIASIAQNEGEKWGGVCGIIGAFALQSLGGIPYANEMLPLLYVPVGFIIGILSGYYLNNSMPVKILYIAGCGILRAAVTTVVAKRVLGAGIGDILTGIVIPEFFSTALIAPVVYFLVYISLKHFHKTRAQRTDGGGERP